MALLNTDSYRDELVVLATNAKVKLDIVAAFLTAEGLSHLLDHLGEQVSVRVVSRWRLGDLLSGASDLASYLTLAKYGIPFYVHPGLHAKVVLCDNETILIGSANITMRGLGLAGVASNVELGTRTTASNSDLIEIEAIFASAVLMTADLFRELEACVAASQALPAIPDYPPAIRLLIEPVITGLWVRDLFWCSSPIGQSPENEDVAHDHNLIGAPTVPSDSFESERLFGNLKAVIWLIQQLKNNDGELFFGSLTGLLHQALLEDPKPYRKDIKTLTSNLLAWCSHFLPRTMVLDVPNFSQRVRLINEYSTIGPEVYWHDKLLQLRQDHDPQTWSRNTLFASPHKPLFILSILKAVLPLDAGDGSFTLTPQVVEQFRLLWLAALPQLLQGDPFLPFVHLSSDRLWTLSGADGQILTPMTARALPVAGRAFVRANIDRGLLSCFKIEEFRQKLTEALVRRYFDSDTAAALINASFRGNY